MIDRETRSPMRIFAVKSASLDQLWFLTNLKKSRALASLIARIVPVEYIVRIHVLKTGLPRHYIKSPQPLLMNPKQRNQPCNEPPISSIILENFEGRGQQFTPAEKAKSFLALKAHIDKEYWVLLQPVGALVSLPRIELPPMRALKQMRRAHA